MAGFCLVGVFLGVFLVGYWRGLADGSAAERRRHAGDKARRGVV